MELWHYFYHGLNVASELPFPEWEVFAQTSAPADSDVLISLGSASPGSISDSSLAAAGERAVIERGEYGLRVANIGDFRVQDGCRILIKAASGAESGALRQYVLGSAWAALCHQRGILAIHASAIDFDSGAVVFCGRSGKGKSTTAAYFATQGHAIMSDDLCCFRIPSEGHPLLYPSAPRVKLWTETSCELGWNQLNAQADPIRADKFHFPLDRRAGIKPLPAKAIYLLKWGELSIRRLSGSTAFRSFLQTGTYRGRVIERLGELADHVRLCARLLDQVPVFEFSRPQGARELNRNVHLLTEHLSNQL